MPQIHDCGFRVEQLWRLLDLGARHHLRDIVETSEALALALCEIDPPHAPIATAAELRAELEPDEIIALKKTWLEVQAESSTKQTKLQAELELRVAENDSFTIGQMNNAYQAGDAGRFYGVPIEHVTDGQLVYYFALLYVFDRVNNIPEGKTRCVSLETLREKAGRSGNTSQRAGV